MQFFLSLLLSLGLVFGFTPTLAYADSATEYGFGSTDPDGKGGRFGYAMSLDNIPAYFSGTENWELNGTNQGLIGGQELQYYANGGKGWRKYRIEDRFFSTKDMVQINPLAPVSPNKNVDFLFWYQKDVTRKGTGVNGGKSFYLPGDVLFYDGGTGTPGQIPNDSNVYSVDAIWSIWEIENNTLIYDGESHLPTVNYRYDYNSTKGENFNKDIQEQLQELVELAVEKDGKQFFTSNNDWSKELNPNLELTSAAQSEVGSYNYNCSVKYRYEEGMGINPIHGYIAMADNSANLTIEPRPITITGSQVRDYTGDIITVDFTDTEFTSWTESSEKEGLVPNQNIKFNIPVSGLTPGKYTIAVNNDNVIITDANDENVTSNYKIDGQVELIITGRTVNVTKQVIQDENMPAPDAEFTINASCGDFNTSFTLKDKETKTFYIPENGELKLEEINIPDKFTFVNSDINEEDNIINATITNRYADYSIDPWPPSLFPIEVFGSLTIGKTVEPNNQDAYDSLNKADDIFTFSVQVGNDSQTIKLKAGETQAISNIPMNTAYIVKEIDIPEGYKVQTDNPIAGIINLQKQHHTIDIVNNWTFEEDPGEPLPPSLFPVEIAGSLTVTKQVETAYQEQYDFFEKHQDTFTFEIQLGDKKETFELKTGESKTFDNIPLNTAYIIREINLPDNYIQKDETPIVGIITLTNRVQSQTITNIWEFEEDLGETPELPMVPVPIVGSLTIEKQVETEKQNLYEYFNKAEDEFTFEVTIGENKETIKLKAGEQKVYSNILIDTSWSIKEINIPEGYTIDNNTIEGKITLQNRNQNASFVNTWDYNFTVVPGEFPDFTVDPEEPAPDLEPTPEPDPEPNPTPDLTPDPSPEPEPDPVPEPDDPPIIEPEPEPSEPVIDEPTIDEPNKEEFKENKPVIEKPKTATILEKTLPKTGDRNYIWSLAVLAILAVIGLFIARRFE